MAAAAAGGATKAGRQEAETGIRVYADVDIARAMGLDPTTLKGDAEEGRDALTYQAPTTDLEMLCNKMLEGDYVITVRDYRANVFVVQSDIVGGEQASDRGFAMLEYHPTNKTLEVIVLCNAGAGMGKRTRAALTGEKTLPGGKALLNKIQEIGAGVPNGVFLYALETVIPYYWQYGWRFASACTAPAGKRGAFSKDVAKIAKFYATDAVAIMESTSDKSKVEEALTESKLLEPLRGHAKDFYSDKLAATRAGAAATEARAEGGASRSTSEHHAGESRDNGYRMLWCPGWKKEDGNAWWSAAGPMKRGWWKEAPAPAGASTGGRRRRRKRTKKRALKKKHRRRRKTLRRRRRRRR